MTEAPKRRRRWFRFSLRTLFVVVTVVGGWLGYELNWIHQRHQFLEAQHTKRVAHRFSWDPNDDYRGDRTAPGLLRFLGESGYSWVDVWVDGRHSEELTATDLERAREARRLFPEAEIGLFNAWEDGPGGGYWEGSAP